MPVSRFVIRDASMTPAYRPGERVVVSRLIYRFRSPAAGDVVVLRDPERPDRYLIKRIDAALDDGPGPHRFEVRGDNAAESRDSRSFGPVRRDQIVGKVWFRY